MKFNDVLKTIGLDEMSMPGEQLPVNSANTIKEIYNAVVVKKMVEGDHLGRLQAAVDDIKKSPSLDKYADVIKMAIAAKNAIMANKAKKNPNQAIQTANKGVSI